MNDLHLNLRKNKQSADSDILQINLVMLLATSLIMNCMSMENL